MNENNTSSVRARRRFLSDKLIALRFEANHIRVDIVCSKTQVVNPTTTLLEVSRNGACTVERVNELNTGRGKREEGGRRLRCLNILCTFVI